MALFGDPGHFNAADWTASWQLVKDNDTHTQSDSGAHTDHYRRANEVTVPLAKGYWDREQPVQQMALAKSHDDLC